MADFTDYAPINRTLTYNDANEPGRYSMNFSVDRETLGDPPSDPYAVEEDYYTKIVLREHKVCPSRMAYLYFSVSNIKRIQKLIRREIYNRSFGKFRLNEDQNVLDLIIAMTIVYEFYGKDLPTQIVRQVKRMNAETVQYVAPDMMTNFKQHYGYLRDIKNPRSILPPPLNVNRSGRLHLPGTAQLYGI
jgi:hypothetical protein